MSKLITNVKDFANSANGGSGSPYLENGQLINNANQTLRHEEWKVYDDALIQVTRTRLNLVKDLMAKGLTRPLGGIGDILAMYEQVSDMTKANVSMDARTRDNKDRLTFDQVGVPIPVFHKEWEMGHRQLESSRSRGASLDVTSIEIAGRIVLDEIENHIVNGVANLSVSGNKLYGYVTHPNRNTYTLQANWAADSGKAIRNDLLAMVQILRDEHYTGPFTVYVGSSYSSHLQTDYSDNKGDNSIMDALETIREIEKVEIADHLAPDEIVVIQLTSDVVDLALAVDLQTIQWSVQPMSTDFMTYAMMAVRVKTEKNGRCGICHGSPA